MGTADMACYVAKQQGRKRVHVYQDDDQDVAAHQGEMQWVPRINQALEAGSFVLYSQLIVTVDPASPEPDHYEILLRLVDQDGKLIAPFAFIPAAERYQLMPSIDRWVLQSTLTALGEHPTVFNKRDGICTINLSGQSLSDERFADFVVKAIGQSKVPFSALCFEITETAAIANFSAAVAFISLLKAKGCHFALDDFGSGLSSFSYLKSLPVDYLKIDGSFVKEMADDPVSAAMVASINQIGHVMGLQTIAEFVENDAIRAKLGTIGVDFAQGYGVARPRPFREQLIELSSGSTIDKAAS
jgi:EAL domain-containing protein (putative c-di-GMP-specific phosphodiesterase class I)